MRKRLSAAFFSRPPARVARDLLGKYLARKTGRKILALPITEVEAYGGPEDRASHARHGRTGRNYPMFKRGGCWYIYFTYGMHWLLNIVTGSKGRPSAVLIRGIRGISGPARVTKFFEIGRSVAKQINNKPANPRTGLWIEDRGLKIKKAHIKISRRIGVDYAGPVWSRKPWRFYCLSKENLCRKAGDEFGYKQ